MRYLFRMEPNWDLIKRRIAEQLEIVGLSERAASIEATGSPDALRFLRTRNVMPSGDRLSKLAFVLRATPGYLLGIGGESGTNGFEAIMQGAAEDLAPPAMPALDQIGETFPVYVTFPMILEGYSEIFGIDDIEVGCMADGQPFRTLRVPLALVSEPALYAFIMPGSAMEPAFSDGELLVAGPARLPKPGDFVLVKMGDTDRKGDRIVVVGKLVRRTNKAIVVVQLSRPDQPITLPNERFQEMHMIMRTQDLVGDLR